MNKKYPTSKLFKILSLGFKRYFFKIENDILTIIQFSSIHIDINNIEKISYEVINVRRSSYSYVYTITEIGGKQHKLPYSALEGNIYKEFIEDLVLINPKIELSEGIIEFLSSSIPNFEFRPDFKFHKGNFFARDEEFSQKYPSLDALIGFTLVFILFGIPILFGGYGHSLLEGKFGNDYQTYRIWTFVFSGIFLALVISNLIISFASMYLGHKTTIGLIILSALCLIISIL